MAMDANPDNDEHGDSKIMQNRRLTVSLVLIIVCFPFFVSAQTLEINSKAVEYYEMGRQEYGLREYNKAIEDFQQAVKINPKFVKAYNMLGFCSANLMRFDDALRYAQQALKIDPKNTLLQLHLGQYYLDLNQYQDSINEFNTVINANTLGDQYYMAYYGLGLDYLDFENPVKALDAFAIAAFRHPIDDVLLATIVFKFITLRDDQGILDYIEQVLKKRPNDPFYWIQKGFVLKDMKKFTDAKIAYEMAMHIYQKSGNMKMANWLKQSLQNQRSANYENGPGH